MRMHWGIENGCHWTMDVVLGEDDSQPCQASRASIETVSWLRIIGYNAVSALAAAVAAQGPEAHRLGARHGDAARRAPLRRGRAPRGNPRHHLTHGPQAGPFFIARRQHGWCRGDAAGRPASRRARLRAPTPAKLIPSERGSGLAHAVAATRVPRRQAARIDVAPARLRADLNPDWHVWSYLKGMFSHDAVGRRGARRGGRQRDERDPWRPELVRSSFAHPAIVYVKQALSWYLIWRTSGSISSDTSRAVAMSTAAGEDAGGVHGIDVSAWSCFRLLHGAGHKGVARVDVDSASRSTPDDLVGGSFPVLVDVRLVGDAACSGQFTLAGASRA